jgi:hypothetical protein
MKINIFKTALCSNKSMRIKERREEINHRGHREHGGRNKEGFRKFLNLKYSKTFFYSFLIFSSLRVLCALCG